MAPRTHTQIAKEPTLEMPGDRGSSARSRIRSLAGAFTVLVVAGAVIVVLWFSLTSRGFSIAGSAADQARDVVRGVESTLDTNIIDRSDIPWAFDEVAHLIGWGSITMAAGLLLRSVRSLADIAVGVFAASFGVEILQAVFASARQMQAEDVSANALGVMLAMMVLVALERIFPARPRVV